MTFTARPPNTRVIAIRSSFRARTAPIYAQFLLAGGTLAPLLTLRRIYALPAAFP